jgi:phosphatidylethanolamine/phosphatidyl-N-methylethanolamine N-methyltransferase
MKRTNKPARATRHDSKQHRLRLDINAVQRAYRRYAGLYDWYFGAVLHRGRRQVIERMNCRPGDNILEVGVGTGLSLTLYPRSVRVTGIDISREMLEHACVRKVHHGLDHVIDLREMDAEQMQFDDNSFDKVVASYVVSVVPHPTRLVDEMRRVCKPDGELFIVNHFRNSNPIISRIERLLAPLSRLLGFHPDFSLDTFIEETSLEVIESHPANLFGYWTLLRARNNKQPLSETLSSRQAVRAKSR